MGTDKVEGQITLRRLRRRRTARVVSWVSSRRSRIQSIPLKEIGMSKLNMLRSAVASDIAGIQHVRRSVRENRLESTVISDEDVREAIERTGRGWVIESQGEIVAFSICNAKSGNIWALFVHPDYERRGYGRHLHDTMVSWLWSQRLDRLWLTTEPGTRAQRFYEAAGWQLTGQTDRGELRFEMQRLLRNANNEFK